MHAKFQVAGFQNERDVRHPPVHLPVQVTWWFFASDGSEIQARVEDFRPVHEDFPLNVFFFLYVNKVFHTYFVVYGSFIFQNINFQS